MSGVGNGPDLAADRNDASAVAPTVTDGIDAVGAGGTSTAGTSDSPAPLISLTSLLGGTIESGTSCAADGTCD